MKKYQPPLDARKLKRHLVELTKAVKEFLTALDIEMKSPSSEQRGRRVARIATVLEMANDAARYFGLGVDYRKDKKK